jgi:hypothetical protein
MYKYTISYTAEKKGEKWGAFQIFEAGAYTSQGKKNG